MSAVSYLVCVMFTTLHHSCRTNSHCLHRYTMTSVWHH